MTSGTVQLPHHQLASLQIAKTSSPPTHLSSALPRQESDDDGDDSAVQEQAQQQQQQQQLGNRPSWFVVQVTAVASLGGVLFGYDLGVISSALPLLTLSMNLSSGQQEWTVSILYLGGGLGAAVGGTLVDVCGRKRIILWTDIFFIVGAVLLYTAQSYATILFGRFVVGFAVAVSGIADVSYLHEIAPSRWRGAIVSVNEACISFGFLLAFATGCLLTQVETQGQADVGNEGTRSNERWREMFGLAGVLALVQFVGMIGMPESPKWLKEQGRYEDYDEALRRIHGRRSTTEAKSNDVVRATARACCGCCNNSLCVVHGVESNAMSTTVSFNLRSLRTCQLGSVFSRFYMLCQETFRRYPQQVIITMFFSIAQQLCGQTNVLSYAPNVLASASGSSAADSADQNWATLSIGLVKFIVTSLVILKIEEVGRRKLLLLGLSFIAAGLALLLLAFSKASFESDDENDNAQDESTGKFLRQEALFAIALTGLLCVVCGYSMSFGPLTWLITSEIFPTEIRGRALGMSTVVTYLCAWVVTDTFLTSQRLFGTQAVFLSYLLITLLAIVFSYLAVPDTGGKSVKQIEHDLNLMPFWAKRKDNHRDSFLDGERRTMGSYSSFDSVSDGGSV